MREYLEQQLAERGSSWREFSELMIRLLDYGVLCRDESKVEAELYDRYRALADLVEDYLAVLDIRSRHDAQFQTLRLFPPGAEVPGLADVDSPFNSGLRSRLSQGEVAVVLALRAEYDKALREGQIGADGSALLSLEALNLSLKNLLGRSLPEAVTERRALFRRLRQLRLIRSGADDDFDHSEAWLSIRPDITGLVSDSVLANLIGDDEAATSDSNGEEQPACT